MSTAAKLRYYLILFGFIAACGSNGGDMPSSDATATDAAADGVLNPLTDADEMADKGGGSADALTDDNAVADADATSGGLDTADGDSVDRSIDTGSSAMDGDATADGAGAADADASADGSADAAPLPVGPSPSECDAGDLNWSRRAITALLGRKPVGLAEAQAVTDLAAVAGRKVAAQTLMQHPDFMPHWSTWLTDELAVNRTGYKRQKPCFDAPLLPKVDADLAIFVRDHQPEVDKFAQPFRLIDLLKSALQLDDLSPIYRAHLFALVAHPLTQCNNPTIEELDLERRADVAKPCA